jgi:hypothetical protein
VHASSDAVDAFFSAAHSLPRDAASRPNHRAKP